DADDRCLAHLSTIVPGDCELALYHEPYGTVGNNFIGARPNHPVIVRALDLAVQAINRGDRDVVWLSTGPGLLSRALAGTIAEAASSAEFLAHTIVFERRELGQAVAAHCQANYKRTQKHWLRSAFPSRPTRAAAQGSAAGGAAKAAV